MVVLVVIFLAHGILAVAHTTHRTTESNTIFLVNGHDRRHLQGVFHRRYVHLLGVGNGEILTHTDHLINMIGSVHTCRQVFKVGILQYTIVLLVAQREHRGVLLVGMRKRNIVVAGKTGARNLVYPVGIGEAHGLLAIDETIVATINRIIHVFRQGRIPHTDGGSVGRVDVDTVVLSVGHGVDAVVKGGLHHGRNIFTGVAELHLGLRGIELRRQIG